MTTLDRIDMAKPQWLKDREMQARRIVVEPDYCRDCIYYGRFVKHTKHKGKEWVEVHECDIHAGHMMTKYTICCDDFSRL